MSPFHTLPNGKLSKRFGPAAFSLVELLVVISIIGILIAILIPTVGRVRLAAQTASTQALISKLQNAAERYNQDYSSYPGPLSDDQVGGQNVQIQLSGGARFTQTTPASVPQGATVAPFVSVTGTENLVLGLLGGLTYNSSPGSPGVEYNASLVGRGPQSLNPAALKSPAAYIDSADISGGSFRYENVLNVSDSVIPEFVDKYADPMPILYLRARRGAPGVAGYGPAGNAVAAQYNLAHILGYTSTNIGQPRKLIVNGGRKGPTGGSTASDGRNANIPGTHGLRDVAEPAPPAAGASVWEKANANFRYPYDLSIYASDPSTRTAPRAKDTFLLISAGPDRIYGTNDDITSFGQIAP